MTTRPRIAIVAPSLGILGGQGVQARILCERLRDDGYPVLFVPVDPRFPAPLRALKRYRYLRTLVTQALYLPSLRRLRDVDVVHVFSASYASFVLAPLPALLAARALGKRVVLNYHSGEADDHLTRWRPVVRPALRLADVLVVPSRYLGDVFARHGHRARVVPNVVDTARFPYRERRPLRPALLSTRNLEPYYRVDTILDALGLVRRRRPDATLTIAGFGGERTRLERLAAAVAGGAVRFLGKVEPHAMPAVYGEGDIFVNASVVDNQPLSILEAFAAGLPVVSTPTGDIGAMVRDGETGLLVPPADPPAMADAVLRLLDDEERARAMAREARRQAEARTWARLREAWADVYEGAAA